MTRTAAHAELRRIYASTKARLEAGDDWLQDDDGTFSDAIGELVAKLDPETARKATAAFRALGVR